MKTKRKAPPAKRGVINDQDHYSSNSNVTFDFSQPQELSVDERVALYLHGHTGTVSERLAPLAVSVPMCTSLRAYGWSENQIDETLWRIASTLDPRPKRFRKPPRLEAKELYECAQKVTECDYEWLKHYGCPAPYNESPMERFADLRFGLFPWGADKFPFFISPVRDSAGNHGSFALFAPSSVASLILDPVNHGIIQFAAVEQNCAQLTLTDDFIHALTLQQHVDSPVCSTWNRVSFAGFEPPLALAAGASIHIQSLHTHRDIVHFLMDRLRQQGFDVSAWIDPVRNKSERAIWEVIMGGKDA